MNALVLFVAALLLPLPAFAHVGDALHHGLLAGFLHPFGGADHLLAMVMVGLWAGLAGGAARLTLPGAFLGAMAVGGGLGMAGVVLPGVEAGILGSVIVLGALAALTVRLPLAVGMALAALFGVLHGHAHGAEMLGGSAFGYALGVLVGTAVLHGAGLAIASPVAPWARRAARAAGGATAVAGLALVLFG
jgi:urease accessory protein